MNGRIKKKIKFWTVFIIAYFSILSGISFFGDNGLAKIWRLRKLKQQLTEQLYSVELQNLKLAKDINDLRSTRSFLIEKEMREQLGLARNNEIIYRFASPTM